MKIIVCLSLLLASLAQPLYAIDFGFGDIGKTFDTLGKLKDATVDIDEPEEIELGSGIAGNLLGAAPLLNDPGLQQYVNKVGLWLALQTERPDLPWRFAVLDDSNINAFATPGGNIFITQGLLQRMRNEAELAGVLAHEITHVLKKHHLEAIKKRARTSLLADLAVAAADRKGRHPALGKLASAGAELYALGLDKDDEFEADRMGVVIAARAGYDPYGLPAVLQILESINPEDSDFALMFKTHPAPTERLQRLDVLMAKTLDGNDARPILATRFYTALGRALPVAAASAVPAHPSPAAAVDASSALQANTGALPPAADVPAPPNPVVPAPGNAPGPAQNPSDAAAGTPGAPAVAGPGIPLAENPAPAVANPGIPVPAHQANAAPPAPAVSPQAREQLAQAEWARQQEEAWQQRVQQLQARQAQSSPAQEPAVKQEPQQPLPSPPATQPAPAAASAKPAVIKVLKASYSPQVNSNNIGKSRDNGTAALAAACNGKSSCDYRIDAKVISEVVPNVPNAYAAQWQCGNTIWTASVEAEANGYLLNLSCD